MDEKILNAISDLRDNVSERIEQIVNLVESCPEISSKLNYEAIIGALFTPPKRSVTEIKTDSVSGDLDKSILSNPLNLVELPKDSSKSELSNVLDFYSLSCTNKEELIEDDNFDPLLITDDVNNDSKSDIPSERSNLDLLLDLNHNVDSNEAIIPEESVSGHLNHENSNILNTASNNENNNNFKNNSFEILSNGYVDFSNKKDDYLPKSASPSSLDLVNDYQDLKKTSFTSELVQEKVNGDFSKKSDSLDLINDYQNLKNTSFNSDLVKEKYNDYFSKEYDSNEFDKSSDYFSKNGGYLPKSASPTKNFNTVSKNENNNNNFMIDSFNILSNGDVNFSNKNDDYLPKSASPSLDLVNDYQDFKKTSFSSELVHEKVNGDFSKKYDSNNEFGKTNDFSKNNSVCNSSFGKMAETNPNVFQKFDEFEDKNKLEDLDFLKSELVVNYPLLDLKEISQDPQAPVKEISLTFMPVPQYDQFIDVTIAEVNNSRNFYLYINEEYKSFSDYFNDYYQCMLKTNEKKEALNEVELIYKKIYTIFNQEDGRFYRAQLLKYAYMENFWTLLVDYGKMKAVHKKYIYELDSEFEVYPIMALSCFLNVSWNKDCKEVETGFFQFMRLNSSQNQMQIKAKFEKPISNRYPVSLVVKPMGEDNWKSLADLKVQVEVSDELNNKFFDFSKFYTDPLSAYSKSNLESFLSFCGLLTMKSPHVTLDTKFPAISPYIYTISKFICIIQSYENSGTCDPDHFTTNLSFFYENYALQADSKLNSLIVFRYRNFFFRGFILKCVSKEYQVLSIDFAFIANNVSMENIYPLVEYFALEKYPMFACLCSLDNVMPASKAWSPLAFETFRTWVQSLQKFTIIPKMFLKFTNSMYSVDLKLQNNEQSASELLIKMKYGISMVEKNIN